MMMTVVWAFVLIRRACGCLGSQRRLSINVAVWNAEALFVKMTVKRKQKTAVSMLLIFPVGKRGVTNHVHVCDHSDPAWVDCAGPKVQRAASDQRKGDLTGMIKQKCTCFVTPNSPTGRIKSMLTAVFCCLSAVILTKIASVFRTATLIESRRRLPKQPHARRVKTKAQTTVIIILFTLSF